MTCLLTFPFSKTTGITDHHFYCSEAVTLIKKRITKENNSQISDGLVTAVAIVVITEVRYTEANACAERPC